MITEKVIKKISSIVSVFETGKQEPDYRQVTLLNDGPNRIRQITYGKHQTTEFGNLKNLIEMYLAAGGNMAFKKYITKIGQLPSLWTNAEFITLLKESAKEKLMQGVQDQFFRLYYLQPAIKFFTDNKFTLPLSLLVIYDSYVHSGGIPGFLRKRFAESPPAKGGDENKWVTVYVDQRDNWLETHSNKLLQNTDYRTDSFILAIREGNWMLDQPFKVVNYKKADETDVPVVRATVA